MYPSAIPSQWYSLLPQFNKSQKIRKFTWGRFPNSSPQASCFTGMTRTNHQGIFPFKYSLELFHLILITGNVLQKGRKKKQYFWPLSMTMGGTKHDKSHILNQLLDQGLFYNIVLPSSYLAERNQYKRSAYSDQLDGDLK